MGSIGQGQWDHCRMNSQLDYLDTLSAFICDTRLEDLSAETLQHGRWVIADSIPVIAKGMQVSEMRALVDEQLAGAGAGNCWVLGSGRVSNAVDASVLNGTAGVWLELDEGNLFAKGHPGIQVVPAALAIAQEIGASGAELLLAVILGYEVSARISRAANVRTCVHPHGTYGVIGAAIAVGRLKKFSAPQMRNLISMAATMGLATSRNTLLEGSPVRNIYSGQSAGMGLMAVRMAVAGFHGEQDGVSSVYGGGVLSEHYDPKAVTEGLGTEWLMTKGYFKLHCTGRYVHSAIDALEDALAQTQDPLWGPEQILRIDVKAYRLAAMLSGKNITTSFGARFSVPFALATLLHHGRSNLAAFSEEAVADPAVQALVARVFVEEEPSYTARFPDLQLCDVHLHMKDGSKIHGKCEVTKGEPANPHAAEDLRRKFFDLGLAVWDEPTTQRLYEACMGIEQISDFGEFSSSLRL